MGDKSIATEVIEEKVIINDRNFILKEIQEPLRAISFHIVSTTWDGVPPPAQRNSFHNQMKCCSKQVNAKLELFFWRKGTFDLIGKNISSALGIVTVNWMQQWKRKKEHADPRELPNQLTTNSGTNFCIAS